MRTDRHGHGAAIVAFCNFAKAPKMANPQNKNRWSGRQWTVFERQCQQAQTRLRKCWMWRCLSGEWLERWGGNVGQTDQQELNCPRLAVCTASVVIVLLVRRITDCRHFEGNLETSGVSNPFITWEFDCLILEAKGTTWTQPEVPEG